MDPKRPEDQKDQKDLEADHRPTEEQVDMKDTVPQRIDNKGTKVEDVAGTGEQDSKGG
jgi:hypothetical protein